MKHTLTLLTALLLAPLAAMPAADAATKTTESKPNIVIILADDLGWADLACYGSRFYETPNVDRLATHGMRFTDAYAAGCVCSPTRASILTGKYPGRLHITTAIPIDGHLRLKRPPPLLPPAYCKNMPLEEVTLAEALKAGGYTCASVGKWHVCWDKEFFPEHQGFDLNVAGNGMGNPGNYFFPYDGEWRMTPKHPKVRWRTIDGGHPGEYLTDRLTDEAIRFMKDCHGKQQPFFLSLSHYAVHTPLQAKNDLIEKYRKKPPTREHKNPVYAAMIQSVDESVGRVMRTLDDLGVADNTIVIFTSDNGGVELISSQRPFRGGKTMPYEGGHRVPLIVCARGVKAGGECSVPVVSTDYYPTVLEMAGLPARPEQHVDGVSLVPLLTQTGGLTRDALYWHFPHYAGETPAQAPSSTVRMGDWKLIEFLEDKHVELYNLKDDLGETRDLAAAMPEKAAALRERLAQWRTKINAQMPVPNPDHKPEPSARPKGKP
ncbi:MAG: sulfatase [Verrucomicrobia bacterium]|nr:sulfatase [Verrucomicrobiota bacterium]